MGAARTARAPWLGACFVLVAAYAIYEKSLWSSPGGQAVDMDACFKNWIVCIVMMPYWFWAAIACMGVWIATRSSQVAAMPEAAPVSFAPAPAPETQEPFPVKMETPRLNPPQSAVNNTCTIGRSFIGQYNSAQPLMYAVPGSKSFWHED
jgi:hypothetical protein